MTEDFASDMYLLRDLLHLAKNNGHEKTNEWTALNIKLQSLEGKATDLMESVQELKRAYNPANRDLLIGLWCATFEDPTDPAYEEMPVFDPELDEAELIRRAKATGAKLNDLFDELKAPHQSYKDGLAQGEVLAEKIAAVRRIPGMDVDLKGDFKRLGDMLDRMLTAFQKMGGAGGGDTSWPSNYVSSSSSSSSSGYP